MDANKGRTFGAPPDETDEADAPVRREPQRAPSGARFFTKQEIVDADDSEYEDVPVPEWTPKNERDAGRVWWVRTKALSTGERSKVEAKLLKQTADGEQRFDASNMRQLFLAHGIVDGSGARMFSDKEIHLLAAKSSAATDRVYESITRMSRMSKSDLAELVGNSPADPSDGSSGGTAND